MKKLILSGLCCTGLFLLLPETGRAHGGQYRGPGDTVPPGGGGGGGSSGGPSGPTTGGPGGPSAPSPTGPTTGGGGGPSTGGPSGPGGGSGPTTRGRGAAIDEDVTLWLYWWEFNKDPFIRLREAVQAGGTVTGSDDYYIGTRRSEARDSLKPTQEQILGDVLPALKKALDSTDQRDMTSSCMVAMAKIGENHTDFNLIDIFKPRLKKPDQEIRETAALAIGIAAIAGEAEVEALTNLVKDNEKGRELCGGSVDNRTRSFAAYGLGLLAYRQKQVELKSRVFQTLKAALVDEWKKSSYDRNIIVAAISSIGLLNVGSSTDEEKALLGDALTCLETVYFDQVGAGKQILQSHCATAIAKLIGRDHEKSDYFKEKFAEDLQEKGKVKRSSNQIFQSCALALGQMVRPNEEKDEKKNPDAKYSKLLLDVFHDHKDIQTRNFAALALGQIGGVQNRDTLLKEFDKAKAQEKPWIALSLGVYSFFKYESQKEGNVEIETKISELLIDRLKAARNPDEVGALAIALGLNRAKDAADLMREMMRTSVAEESKCGYLCIGLALMNDTKSLEDIRGLLPQSVRRFTLLPQAAIALGKLGDKKIAEDLQKLMTDGEPNLAKLSAIASALGFIGDSRTIAPLKKILFDEKLGDLSRAFAAVALGGVADKEMLPWNSKIATNINYLANTETLTNKSTGILDIL